MCRTIPKATYTSRSYCIYKLLIPIRHITHSLLLRPRLRAAGASATVSLPFHSKSSTFPRANIFVAHLILSDDLYTERICHFCSSTRYKFHFTWRGQIMMDSQQRSRYTVQSPSKLSQESNPTYHSNSLDPKLFHLLKSLTMAPPPAASIAAHSVNCNRGCSHVISGSVQVLEVPDTVATAGLPANMAL